MRSRVPARGVYAISCLVTAVPTLVIALTHSVGLVAVMLVAAGAAWITGLGLLSAAYQGELPAWAKARAFAYYLVAFQGAMGVGALVLGALAQATSVTTALIVVAAGLAASVVLTWLLPMPEGAAAAGLEHAADPLPLPEELTEEFGVTGRRGPVTVTVAYALADGNADKFLEHAKQLRRMRRRTGASTGICTRTSTTAALLGDVRRCLVGGAPAPARPDRTCGPAVARRNRRATATRHAARCTPRRDGETLGHCTVGPPRKRRPRRPRGIEALTASMSTP